MVGDSKNVIVFDPYLPLSEGKRSKVKVKVKLRIFRLKTLLTLDMCKMPSYNILIINLGLINLFLLKVS